MTHNGNMIIDIYNTIYILCHINKKTVFWQVRGEITSPLSPSVTLNTIYHELCGFDTVSYMTHWI